MFKWTSAFHTQLLFSTLMEPSYISSEKHLKAELLGAYCNFKTFSLELQWSESLGGFYGNSSILFSSNTKCLWALLYKFLEGGECTIDFNTKNVKGKVEEPEKRICHCVSQGTESQEGTQEHEEQSTLNF